MNRHVVKIASGILLLLAIPAGSYYGYKTMQDAEKREQAAALEQGIALPGSNAASSPTTAVISVPRGLVPSK